MEIKTEDIRNLLKAEIEKFDLDTVSYTHLRAHET